jgi:hypothetical protein
MQYGWTSERVFAAAAVFIAACHALGYARAAFARPWLHTIERWNVYCSLALLAVLLALFLPLADPARIAVNDQVARLERGAVAVPEFDFYWLRWNAGRYGKAALEELAARQGDAYAAMREKANNLLHATEMRHELPERIVATRPDESNLRLHTPDGKLPAGFLAQDWSKQVLYDSPECLRLKSLQSKCDIFVKDLKGNGSQQIIVVPEDAYGISRYDRDAKGVWHFSGYWRTRTAGCASLNKALRAGQFSGSMPPPSRWVDLRVAGQLLIFTPNEPREYAMPHTCAE